MTKYRAFTQTSASTNDNRPPEVRIERISAARLIEALCKIDISNRQQRQDPGALPDKADS